MRSVRVALWSFAIVVVVFAARYFLVPPPWLPPPLPRSFAAIAQAPAGDAALNLTPNLYARHRAPLLVHIACGIVAMILGLLQFVASIRDARPGVHRKLGTIYVVAVIVGSAAGLRLAFSVPDAVRPELSPRLLTVAVSFGALSICWAAITLTAFLRARRSRFEEHRAWMIRSYSLTYAAVTVRLVAPVFLLMIPDPLIAGTAAISTWPVNLVVAEWLVRRKAGRVLLPLRS